MEGREPARLDRPWLWIKGVSRMKFDIDRSMAWVTKFDFPRETGSEGERRAADLMAETLEQGGWHLTRTETRTCCPFSTFVMLVLLIVILEEYWLWRALQSTFPAASRLTRAVLLIGVCVLLGGLLWLVLGRDSLNIARERFAHWRSAQVGRSQVNVIADRPETGNRTSRVIFLTHLDTNLPGMVGEDLACCAAGLILLGLALLHLSPAVTTWSLAGFFGVLLLFHCRYWLRVGIPSPGDNRTGLAVLAELGRSLPPRLLKRSEIYLATVSGNSTGQLGALTLADELRLRMPVRPTLVINLDAPALGSELTLVGIGQGLDLACGAAKDLWIPHRVSRARFCRFDHRPFQINGIPAVSLVGDHKGLRIEPATLAATAQLATEIAMRWARQAAESGPAQSESLPRSSQKPG